METVYGAITLKKIKNLTLRHQTQQLVSLMILYSYLNLKLCHQELVFWELRTGGSYDAKGQCLSLKEMRRHIVIKLEFAQ